jgi:hypothetical protein
MQRVLCLFGDVDQEYGEISSQMEDATKSHKRVCLIKMMSISRNAEESLATHRQVGLGLIVYLINWYYDQLY